MGEKGVLPHGWAQTQVKPVGVQSLVSSQNEGVRVATGELGYILELHLRVQLDCVFSLGMLRLPLGTALGLYPQIRHTEMEVQAAAET